MTDREKLARILEELEKEKKFWFFNSPPTIVKIIEAILNQPEGDK